MNNGILKTRLLALLYKLSVFYELRKYYMEFDVLVLVRSFNCLIYRSE